MAAAVLTYVSPVAGATAPTAALMATRNKVVADVVFADGATVVNLVHNMNIPVGSGFPLVSTQIKASGTALNQLAVAIVDANTVSLTQTLGSANTGGTYRVTVDRPNTATQ
jgi:hypothetical protein